MTEPDFDDDGYPTEETLQRIKDWDVLEDGCRALFEFMAAAWNWPRYAVIEDRKVVFVTGGWSGNEDIIDAFEGNIAFALTWVSSERGGRHVFEIPEQIK